MYTQPRKMLLREMLLHILEWLFLKCLQGKNTLAYFAAVSITTKGLYSGKLQTTHIIICRVKMLKLNFVVKSQKKFST
jgi:hypothetical protein